MGIRMTHVCLSYVTRNSKKHKLLFLLLLLLHLLITFLLPSLTFVLTPYALSPQLSDSEIQDYHDTYRPRITEMHAFNMVSPPYI